MPKKFFSERDIEDLVNRGTLSLEIDDQVVLTDLAYEKAQRLGLKLVNKGPVAPPASPVRPYLSEITPVNPEKKTPEIEKKATEIGVIPPAEPTQPTDLAQRIRSSVIARLGTQIEPQLLDGIITRVLRSTGFKK